jgi:hypothetical protein
MIMHRSIHRLLVAAAVLPLAAGAVSLTTAASAGAATVQPNIACTHPGWTNPHPVSGRALSNGTPVRTGPEASCAVVVTVGSAVALHYHCYVSNSNGSTWTNVRVDGTNINGWVLDGNLAGNGSSFHC